MGYIITFVLSLGPQSENKNNITWYSFLWKCSWICFHFVTKLFFKLQFYKDDFYKISLIEKCCLQNQDSTHGITSGFYIIYTTTFFQFTKYSYKKFLQLQSWVLQYAHIRQLSCFPFLPIITDVINILVYKFLWKIFDYYLQFYPKYSIEYEHSLLLIQIDDLPFEKIVPTYISAHSLKESFSTISSTLVSFLLKSSVNYRFGSRKKWYPLILSCIGLITKEN